MSQKKNLQVWYSGEINNRKIIHSDINHEVNPRHSLRSFFGFSVLILKFLLANFFSVDPLSPVIAISWSNTHTRRLLDLPFSPDIYRLKPYEIDKEQILLCKGVSIRNVVSNARALRAVAKHDDRDRYNFDCYWYRMLFAAEAAWMDQLCRNKEAVYVGGLNDRYAILICGICEPRSTEIVMVQHGLLSERKELYRPKVDRFGYQFEFSKSIIGYSIEAESIFSVPSKSLLSYLPVDSIKSGYIDKWIAVIFDYSSPARNRDIVEAILGIVPDNVGILAYVHPVENEVYKFSDSRVRLEGKDRYSNPWMVVGQVSTLIAEYADAGVVDHILMLDMKSVKTDLIGISQVNIFTSISELLSVLKRKLDE